MILTHTFVILTHIFENSSMLHDASYDIEKQEMTVTFSNGKIYLYEDVEPSLYDGLISAESAGKYFNSIKKDLKIVKI